MRNNYSGSSINKLKQVIQSHVTYQGYHYRLLSNYCSSVNSIYIYKSISIYTLCFSLIFPFHFSNVVVVVFSLEIGFEGCFL